ncbi:Rab-GTPase-TBC domain [Cinara cedri]|uniref:Rab-GTPase-TBC domain n=1 Tax=Cinara cedri TaxID=506608 RepID=A0A5E4MP54_9HEMI|nr:Rab-GTPase-TBC domain [Cinara cedri]
MKESSCKPAKATADKSHDNNNNAMLHTSRYTKRDTEVVSPPALAQMENDYIDEDEDNYSEASSSMAPNGSVVSTVPDKHGFLGGAQYLHESKHLISPNTTKKREQKWLNMTANWDRYMAKNFKKVQNRCRKGIPQSIRPRAWLYLTKANKLLQNNEHYYYELCDRTGDRIWIEDIRKDLHRQFPYHEMFVNQDGTGQKELFNVLKAYTILKPDVGYCQAQAPIAAFLLMHLPAEQAFWCFVAICDDYLSNYYCPGMETLIQDGNILFSLLKEREPHIYKLLRKQSIDPIMYMTEWFLCAFTRTLPWPTLLRFWDVFLFDGVKTLFKMGLILIKISLREKSYTSLKKRFPTMCETLEALRNPPVDLLEEERIIKKLIQMEIPEDTFKYYHKQQETLLRRKTKEIQRPRETDVF